MAASKHVKMSKNKQKFVQHIERVERDVFLASKVGNVKWLQQSLALYGEDFNALDEDGLTALHIAALECQVKIIKFLSEGDKFDVNEKSLHGWTALHLSINNTMVEKSTACVKYLLELGGDPSSETSSGITPMHQAAAVGNIECLKLLLANKAKFNCIDSRGHTPFSLSILWCHPECARLLKHHNWLALKKKEFTKVKLLEEAKEDRRKRVEEREEEAKEEKRLRGQMAYRMWLTKNDFPFPPNLFTSSLTEERIERRRKLRSEEGTRPASVQDQSRSSAVSRSEARRSTPGFVAGSRHRSAPSRKGDTDQDKVNLIPLSSLAAATIKRPQPTGVQFDVSRRQQQVGRPKIVSKRGVLQFPVI